MICKLYFLHLLNQLTISQFRCITKIPLSIFSENANNKSTCQVHFLFASGGNDNLVKLWDILAYTGSSGEFTDMSLMVCSLNVVINIRFNL